MPLLAVLNVYIIEIAYYLSLSLYPHTHTHMKCYKERQKNLYFPSLYNYAYGIRVYNQVLLQDSHYPF